MNPLIRWFKFNLVGAIGMAFQLAALALINRLLHGRYLYASAAAIELTLVHNFLWHLHYTWRDRRNAATPLRQFLRFQLTNGLVSLLGNLALMRLLVHQAHLPVLLANLIAILSCSLANFCLGNLWAFAAPDTDRPHPRFKESIHAMRIVMILLLMLPAISSAQTPPSAPIPEAPIPRPTPRPIYRSDPAETYLNRIGTICGVGASTSFASTKPTLGCGAGATFIPLPIFLEFGVMAPQANRSYLTGYLSLDASIPLAPPSTTYLPMAIVGYSRLFETGHALDYGLALALPRSRKPSDDTKSLRLELRDYWTFANPTQHNVMLRIGWMAQETD